MLNEDYREILHELSAEKATGRTKDLADVEALEVLRGYEQ